MSQSILRAKQIFDSQKKISFIKAFYEDEFFIFLSLIDIIYFCWIILIFITHPEIVEKIINLI